MAKVIDFELHRENSDLSKVEDPCSRCRQVSFCVNTCQYASDWWEEFARKFKRNAVIHQLGGK